MAALSSHPLLHEPCVMGTLRGLWSCSLTVLDELGKFCHALGHSRQGFSG